MTRKRILPLTLAVTMSLSLLPGTALAAEEQERGTFSYEVSIAPQYEDAVEFSEGLAAVKKNGKWGYINTSGETVIPFEYDQAYFFNEGYAVVAKLAYTEEIECDWEYDASIDDYVPTAWSTAYTYDLGFIDHNNNWTSFMVEQYNYETGSLEETPVQITDYGESVGAGAAYMFYNGYIAINWEPETMSYFDTTGHVAQLMYDEESGEYQPFSMWFGYGYQATEGSIAFSDPYGAAYLDLATGTTHYLDHLDIWDCRPFNQGLAPAATEEFLETDEEFYSITRWGIVDTSFNWVIQPAYKDFMVRGSNNRYRVFGETGLAMVKNFSGKWGAIDKTGKTVLPFQYEHLYPYFFGMAAFSQNGKWGYLDEKGNIAIPAQYEIASGFTSNGYAVAYDGIKAFLIDTNGNEIPGTDQLDPDGYFIYKEGYDIPTVNTPGEYVVIKENGKYGFGHVSYLPPLPDTTDMSSWAYTEVVAAIEEDLVPVYLQNLYLNNITRDEFCDLIIQALETVTDKDIATLVQERTGKSLDSYRKAYPFVDSTSSNVVAANALGIISGRGNGIFDPYATITRQEAAALLTRSAGVLGMDTSNISQTDFADSDSVGVWFQDAVRFVSQINVMGGTGNNTFSPLGTYTREQSFMTIYRLFQAIVNG